MERPAPLLLIYKHQGASDSVMQWTVMMNSDLIFFLTQFPNGKCMYLAFGMTTAPFSFLICKFSYYGSSHMQMFPVKPPTFLSRECCVALSLFFLNSLVRMTLPCLAHSKRPASSEAECFSCCPFVKM